MRAVTPGAAAPPVNTQGGVHSRHRRLHRCARACPGSCPETASHAATHAYPTFFQHPPSTPPATSDDAWDAHGTIPSRAPARARRRLTWIKQTPSSTCSSLSGLRPCPPGHAPPRAAASGDARAPRRRSVLGEGACMHCCLGSFCASRLPSQRARLCMCAFCRTHASLNDRFESGPDPPCATRMHSRRGSCANRSACLLALVKIPRLHPTLSLIPTSRRARVTLLLN